MDSGGELSAHPLGAVSEEASVPFYACAMKVRLSRCGLGCMSSQLINRQKTRACARLQSL